MSRDFLAAFATWDGFTMADPNHDDQCESEFIFGPMAYSPCGCRERLSGGWPPGGVLAQDWRECAECRDTIYPGEHVYPPRHLAADSGLIVLCAVCHVKQQRES